MARRDSARLTAKEGRSFGLTVGIAFLLLAALFWWRGRPIPMGVAGSLAGMLLLGGLLVPTRMGPIHRAWMGLAHAISKVTTPIFMSIVYFIVLTPVGLVRRLVARNPLQHEADGGGFWISRSEEPKSDLDRQF